jgi:hypothetical protein
MENIENIKNIEKQLRSLKLLTNNQYLIDEIQCDKVIMDSINITKKDISISFNNILLKLHKSNDYDAFTTLDVNEEIIKSSKIVKNTVFNQIYVNNTTLKVYCQTTMDFIINPFDNCNYDKVYFIISDDNEKIEFTDMEIFNIIKYGFFGGYSCEKRIDPLLLAKIFGLYDTKNKNNIIYPIKTYKQYRWRSFGKIKKNKIYDIDKSYSNDIAKVYLFDGGKKLCVKFKDKYKEIKNSIEIFSIPLFITPEFNTKKWFLFKIIYDDFMVNENGNIDVSEMNNYIKLSDKKILIARGNLVKEDIFDII